jgi:hypothetical protein
MVINSVLLTKVRLTFSFFFLLNVRLIFTKVKQGNRNRKTGEPKNWKLRNWGPDSGSDLEKPKTGYPIFQYPVFTKLPGTGLNIYIFYLGLYILVFWFVYVLVFTFYCFKVFFMYLI